MVVCTPEEKQRRDRQINLQTISYTIAIAKKPLNPGQRVYVRGGDKAYPSTDGNHVGVVDPYLMSQVRVGEQFYILLNPNTITGLKHVWTHPGFPDIIKTDPIPAPAPTRQPAKSRVDKAKKWITEFAPKIGQDYTSIMAAATVYAETGSFTMDNDEGYKEVSQVEWDKFWKMYKIVTKIRPTYGTDCFFTCSC